MARINSGTVQENFRASRETLRVPGVRCCVSYLLTAVTKRSTRIDLREDTLVWAHCCRMSPTVTDSTVTSRIQLWQQEGGHLLLSEWSRDATENNRKAHPSKTHSSSWVPPPRSSTTFQNSTTSQGQVFKHMSPQEKTLYIQTITSAG